MKVGIDQISIRTSYQPGDIGFITYLHGRLYEFGQSFEAYVSETLGSFYKTLNAEKERMWIAEHDGKIIGTIAVKNTNGVAQLRYFLIHPDYRGIGLGKKLMDLFIGFIKDVGYTSSFLLTEKQLETAVGLYKRYGYTYVASNTTDFGLVEMRYELEMSK
jgi:N-acetylglutamate synthase-like GNAT family acetyltransferase